MLSYTVLQRRPVFFSRFSAERSSSFKHSCRGGETGDVLHFTTILNYTPRRQMSDKRTLFLYIFFFFHSKQLIALLSCTRFTIKHRRRMPKIVVHTTAVIHVRQESDVLRLIQNFFFFKSIKIIVKNWLVPVLKCFWFFTAKILSLKYLLKKKKKTL